MDKRESTASYEPYNLSQIHEQVVSLQDTHAYEQAEAAATVLDQATDRMRRRDTTAVYAERGEILHLMGPDNTRQTYTCIGLRLSISDPIFVLQHAVPGEPYAYAIEEDRGKTRAIESGELAKLGLGRVLKIIRSIELL